MADPLCPSCKEERPLEPLVERETEFLGCTACFGLFVSEDDLALYITRATEKSIADAFKELLHQSLDGTVSASKRCCPLCRENLERRGFGESPFVIVDRCPAGHGLWLDKTELKKILRSSRAHAIVLKLVPMTRKYDSVDD